MRLRFIYIYIVLIICTAARIQNGLRFKTPDHFPKPTYDFENNPSSEDKLQLGRALFYDPILSKDNTISCVSCHSPYNAFAHTDHQLSHGINDEIGTRNAPPLFNLAWQSSFNWDGAVHHLDMQALAPINDKREMGESTDGVVSKLQSSDLYPTLFEKAFGESKITGQHMLQALSQFQLSLISANSLYDQMIRGEAIYNHQEENGYALYQQHYSNCHTEPLFTNSKFANNGLPIDNTLNDYGRYLVTNQPEDSLQFKIPSLRNLSYTFPYMHDGRFDKLREVINHYTDGISSSGNLSQELAGGIFLTSSEKTDLIAFLLTLDDQQFVFNKHHQYPREILLQSEGY